MRSLAARSARLRNSAAGRLRTSCMRGMSSRSTRFRWFSLLYGGLFRGQTQVAQVAGDALGVLHESDDLHLPPAARRRARRSRVVAGAGRAGPRVSTSIPSRRGWRRGRLGRELIDNVREVVAIFGRAHQVDGGLDDAELLEDQAAFEDGGELHVDVELLEGGQVPRPVAIADAQAADSRGKREWVHAHLLDGDLPLADYRNTPSIADRSPVAVPSPSLPQRSAGWDHWRWLVQRMAR